MTQTNPEQWARDVLHGVMTIWGTHGTNAAALAIQAAFAEREARLVGALEALYRGYVRTLENGRDRITFLGGECDPVDRMESGDPVLIEARATLAALKDRTHG